MKTFQVSGSEVKATHKPLDKVNKVDPVKAMKAEDIKYFNHSLKTEKQVLKPFAASELSVSQQEILSEFSASRVVASFTNQTIEKPLYNSNSVRELSTPSTEQVKVELTAHENKNIQPVKHEQAKEEITQLKGKVNPNPNANTLLKSEQIKVELTDKENKHTQPLNHALDTNTIKASEPVLNHPQGLREPVAHISGAPSKEGGVTQPRVTTRQFELQRPSELATEKNMQHAVIQNTEVTKPAPLNQSHSKGMLTPSDITAHMNARAFTEQEPKSLEGLVNAKSALLPTPDLLFQQVLKSTKPESMAFQAVATEVLASINLAKSQSGEEMTVKLAHPIFSGSEINFKMENKTLILTFVAKDADVAQLAQQFLPDMKLMLQDKFPQFNHDCLLQNNEHSKQSSKKQDEQKEQPHHEETLNEEELT